MYVAKIVYLWNSPEIGDPQREKQKIEENSPKKEEKMVKNKGIII